MNVLDYTTRITSRLPFWFAMKKKPGNSIGEAFLRVVGMELDEMAFTLDYLYEQLSIDKADTDIVDMCYKTLLPDIDLTTIEDVTGDGAPVTRLFTLTDFFNPKTNVHNHAQLKNIDAYYIDEERKILYSRRPYSLFSVRTNVPHTYNLVLSVHSIWNYFDEFGLLLNTPRLFREDNYHYKQRLKDVFKNKSGAHHQGVLNGLARELGCRVVLEIDNSSKDLILPESMILTESIVQNEEIVGPDRVVRNSLSQTVLLGDEASAPAELTYIHSINLHQMNDYANYEDIPLQSELFYTDGTATPKLKEYALLINTLCPIMWNHARWDESHWINGDFQFGYIPHIMDASIRGFQSAEYVSSIVDISIVDKSYVN